MEKNGRWVQTWGQTHIPLSYFHYPEMQKTYRLIINSAISGEKIKIKLSNACGKNDVTVKNVTVASCDENGNALGNIVKCFLNGSHEFKIPQGESVTLDEAELSAEADSHFFISIYVVKGDLCSGNLMNNALLLTAEGDRTHSSSFRDEPRKRDDVIKRVEGILGFPIHRPIPLFDTVSLLNNEQANAIVVFGDSLSQQGFWTNAFEKRLKKAYPGKYSLINRSAMGNRILRDCSPVFPVPGLYGVRATKRLENDVLQYENISHCIMFIGINDILQYGNLNGFPWEKPDIQKLCEETENMTKAMQSKGIKVMAFDIIAFGKCPDATFVKESLRKEVNAWYKEKSNIFDSFLCVSESIADETNSRFANSDYIGKDKLHINEKGGKLISELIDLDFFA